MYVTKAQDNEYYVVVNNDIPPGAGNLMAILEGDLRFGHALNPPVEFPRARNGSETELFRVDDVELRNSLTPSKPGDTLTTFGPDYDRHLTLVRVIDTQKGEDAGQTVMTDIKQRVDEQRASRRPTWQALNKS